MRFVPSLDDSVMAGIAGLVAAVVAAATALFSGPAVWKSDAAHTPPPPPIAAPTSTDELPAHVDLSHVSPDSGFPLTDRVLLKEEVVDDINAQLDEVLKDVAAQDHRRR